MRKEVFMFEPVKTRIAFHYLWSFFAPWSGIAALGALFSMVPGLNILVYGDALMQTRRTFVSEDISLQPWHNLWHLFKEGLKVLVTFILITAVVIGFSYIASILASLFSSSTGASIESITFVASILSSIVALLAGYFTPAIIVLLSLYGFKGVKYGKAMEISKSWRYFFTVIINSLFMILLSALFAGIQPLYGSAGGSLITYTDYVAMALFTWWMAITSFTLFGLSVSRKTRADLVAKILKKQGRI